MVQKPENYHSVMKEGPLIPKEKWKTWIHQRWPFSLPSLFRAYPDHDGALGKSYSRLSIDNYKPTNSICVTGPIFGQPVFEFRIWQPLWCERLFVYSGVRFRFFRRRFSTFIAIFSFVTCTSITRIHRTIEQTHKCKATSKIMKDIKFINSNRVNLQIMGVGTWDSTETAWNPNGLMKESRRSQVSGGE